MNKKIKIIEILLKDIKELKEIEVSDKCEKSSNEMIKENLKYMIKLCQEMKKEL